MDFLSSRSDYVRRWKESGAFPNYAYMFKVVIAFLFPSHFFSLCWADIVAVCCRTGLGCAVHTSCSAWSWHWSAVSFPVSTSTSCFLVVLLLFMGGGSGCWIDGVTHSFYKAPKVDQHFEPACSFVFEAFEWFCSSCFSTQGRCSVTFISKQYVLSICAGPAASELSEQPVSAGKSYFSSIFCKQGISTFLKMKCYTLLVRGTDAWAFCSGTWQDSSDQQKNTHQVLQSLVIFFWFVKEMWGMDEL